MGAKEGREGGAAPPLHGSLQAWAGAGSSGGGGGSREPRGVDLLMWPGEVPAATATGAGAVEGGLSARTGSRGCSVLGL